MADNDSGEKTEKPTPRRLDDARKKGDVPKSRELTSTAGLLLWFALSTFAAGYAAARLGALFDASFLVVARGWTRDGFGPLIADMGMLATEAVVMLSVLFVVPAAIVGLAGDFLQIGPVLAFEKVKPKGENLNPVEGVKRMFSMDNLIEVIKAVAKTALLGLLGWLIVRSALPQIVMLARAPDLPAQAVAAILGSLTVQLLAWTTGLFVFVSLLDAAYQRYSFTKKMRMSMHDIKEEAKETEGNPLIKGQRRQAHQEWSQQNSAQAARNASVLVVNPTHIAIAIDYDEDEVPVPSISAKGEGDEARVMREAAEEAGTPIVRNIPLARDLFARGEPGEIVPADLFEIIAEVIVWAREVRERVDTERRAAFDPTAMHATGPAPAAPGEDLTRYTTLGSLPTAERPGFIQGPDRRQM